MALGNRNDPYLAHSFLVEVQGVVVGGFNEVSGLQCEVEIKDYREGGVNQYIHQLPGPARFPAKLTLKHGVTNDNSLWQWHRQVADGTVTRRNISVILLDSTGTEKRRWNFRDAYPVKWSGPDLRAGGSAVAIETLELVHRGLME